MTLLILVNIKLDMILFNLKHNHIHCLFSSEQIRFLLVSDQQIVSLPRGTGRNNMWWLNQLPLLPDVVFIPCPVTRRAAAENSDMIIP